MVSYQIIMFLMDHLSPKIHVYTHTRRITMGDAKKNCCNQIKLLIPLIRINVNHCK